eukprot:67631-Chlamydomonas_euryale.AAC.3
MASQRLASSTLLCFLATLAWSMCVSGIATRPYTRGGACGDMPAKLQPCHGKPTQAQVRPFQQGSGDHVAAGVSETVDPSARPLLCIITRTYPSQFSYLNVHLLSVLANPKSRPLVKLVLTEGYNRTSIRTLQSIIKLVNAYVGYRAVSLLPITDEAVLELYNNVSLQVLYGYGHTDIALDMVMQEGQCDYVQFSNGDNIFMRDYVDVHILDKMVDQVDLIRYSLLTHYSNFTKILSPWNGWGQASDLGSAVIKTSLFQNFRFIPMCRRFSYPDTPPEPASIVGPYICDGFHLSDAVIDEASELSNVQQYESPSPKGLAHNPHIGMAIQAQPSEAMLPTNEAAVLPCCGPPPATLCLPIQHVQADREDRLATAASTRLILSDWAIQSMVRRRCAAIACQSPTRAAIGQCRVACKRIIKHRSICCCAPSASLCTLCWRRLARGRAQQCRRQRSDGSDGGPRTPA